MIIQVNCAFQKPVNFKRAFDKASINSCKV